MKTTGREFFYSVSGLMAPKYMVDDNLTEAINRFVEYVPKCTDIFEQFAASALNQDVFVAEMEKLYVLLCAIHAHWLEIEASRILRIADMSEPDLCREQVTPFVTNVRTLAIDIQIAQSAVSQSPQSTGIELNYRKRSETERYKDVVSSMNVIISLLNDKYYKKAFNIAKSVSELQDSEFIMPLISHISSMNKSRAVETAERISGVYKQKLEDINKAAKTTALKKVLVADDMPDILTVVSFILKDYYQVLPFNDGKDVLRAIDAKQQPDAFLLDIDMPKMDGFMLAGSIRKRPAFKTTPILFLTANSTKDNLIKSRNFEPTAFIVKPVNRDIIIARLSSFLNVVSD